MPARVNPPAGEPAAIPNTVTTLAKVPPSTLKKFLADGVEKPECIICRDIYGSKHVAVQIKECGHQFGEHCLKKWLKQKNSEGTCPMCRDILFRATPSPTQSLLEQTLLDTLAASRSAAAAPFPPNCFLEHYQVVDILQASATRGFMQALWYALYYLDKPTGRPSLQDISGAIIQSFEVTNYDSAPEQPQRPARPSSHEPVLVVPEHWVLSPYVYRIRHNDFSFPDECTLTGFANTILKFIDLAKKDECPPSVVWRAVVLYHSFSRDVYPVLSWTELRDETWSLYDTGRGSSQWALLYLFIWLICWYSAQSGINLEDYGPEEVVTFLRALDFGFPDDVTETRDMQSQVCVRAVCHVLKIGDRVSELPAEELRDERLVAPDTDLAQLKVDVEGLWLEGIGLAAHEIASGFPDGWSLGG
jgi:hypothetical protein